MRYVLWGLTVWFSLGLGWATGWCLAWQTVRRAAGER